MHRKGVTYQTRQHGVLRGYRLAFNKKALRKGCPPTVGYANILPDRTGVVEGVLYEIDEQCLGELDQSERTPHHYDRTHLSIEAGDQHVGCWSYVAQPDKIAPGLFPTWVYLDHILAARDMLSGAYCRRLAALATFTGKCDGCLQMRAVSYFLERDRTIGLCRSCYKQRPSDLGTVAYVSPNRPK